MDKLKSMTGFGRTVLNDEKYAIVVEVRSVNGKILDIKWRLPSLIRHFESNFDKIVRQYASRGRVDITISLQCLEKSEDLNFDHNRAKNMLQIVTDFAKSENADFSPDYNRLFSISSLWNSSEDEANAEKTNEDLLIILQNALKSALTDWNSSRQIEAQSLGQDLQKRFQNMQNWLKQIEEKAPIIKEQRFVSVKERLQEVLLSLDSSLDETRFLQEMVILSDKLDVSEEVARLYSHFERLDSLLADGEEIGRKLDFTLQECFREINTCGNKIQDAKISILVVDFKNELEKCREQVQNLE